VTGHSSEEIMTCFFCGAQQHFLCTECSCCNTGDFDDELAPLAELMELEKLEPKKRGPKLKTGSEMKDVLSTGRKRAAEKYGHLVGQVCEWAWQKNCGGGTHPVLGCSGRASTNIHHGPDKSTINNERDNISVICSFCHNLWHAKNDPYYGEARVDEGRPWTPKGDFTPLSEREMVDPIEIIDQELDLNRPKFDPVALKNAIAEWKRLTA